MSAHKIELRVESPSGQNVFGYVVIGIPEEQFLKLKVEFPDKGWSGQDPKLNEAIKEGITEDEKKEIAKHLGQAFPFNTNFNLLFEGITRYVDEAKEKPSFESSGKKFWVFLPTSRF